MFARVLAEAVLIGRFLHLCSAEGTQTLWRDDKEGERERAREGKQVKEGRMEIKGRIEGRDRKRMERKNGLKANE